jgi:DNA-binding IscR family transcriptional regulator
MLRISKLTDYATVVLSVMAEDAAVPHSAAQLAESTHIALPTVSKVLKALQRGGLVAPLAAHAAVTSCRGQRPRSAP